MEQNIKPIHLHIKQRQPEEKRKSLSFKVEVPCSNLVKFYMEKNFGRGKDKLVFIDNTSTVGKFFYKCIENPSNKHDKDYKGYQDSITVNISENIFIRKGILITPTDIISFDNFVTKLIYQSVWLYIDARQDGAVQHYTAKRLMDDFCVKYGYSEDILSYERLKKAKQFRTNPDKGLNIC